MANHKSAEKRARQTKRKTAINGRTRATVRTFEKKVRKALAESDKEAAQNFLRKYTSEMAKAAQKGVFHLKTASRKVSRLAQAVNGL